jgi:hypothetical protein
VTYFGDTSGDGAYSGLDAALASRVASLQDSGFAAFRLVDPVIIADINSNGRIDGSDASFIAQVASGSTAVTRIPALPIPPPSSGATLLSSSALPLLEAASGAAPSAAVGSSGPAPVSSLTAKAASGASPPPDATAAMLLPSSSESAVVNDPAIPSGQAAPTKLNAGSLDSLQFLNRWTWDDLPLPSDGDQPLNPDGGLFPADIFSRDAYFVFKAVQV